MKPKCVQCVYGRSGRCINCDHPAPWLTTRRGFISMLGSGLIVAAVPELIVPDHRMVTDQLHVVGQSFFAQIIRPGIEAEFTKIYAERDCIDALRLVFKTIPKDEVYR